MKMVRGVMTALTVILMIAVAEAGVGGVVIKGVFKTWDEIACVALKVSGKAVSDDSVKITARAIEQASQKYGDDVAEAAMRGGTEVVAKTAKSGGRFLKLIQKSGQLSDEAFRALVANSDEVLKLSAKYGDDVLLLNSKAPGVVSRSVAAVEGCGLKDATSAIRAIASLPAEDIPRVIGAVEKNPSVAKLFIEHVERGGKYFVDKVFALNERQILMGTLGATAIVAVSPGGPVTKAVGPGGPVDGLFKHLGWGCFSALIILSCALGFVIYKRMGCRRAERTTK